MDDFDTLEKEIRVIWAKMREIENPAGKEKCMDILIDVNRIIDKAVKLNLITREDLAERNIWPKLPNVLREYKHDNFRNYFTVFAKGQERGLLSSASHCLVEIDRALEKAQRSQPTQKTEEKAELAMV